MMLRSGITEVKRNSRINVEDGFVKKVTLWKENVINWCKEQPQEKYYN